MRKRIKSYRQGDVLLVPVEAAPKGLQPAEPRNGRYVLAEGEVTGHAHTIAVDDAALLVSEVEMFLELSVPAQLTHQEHATIDLPAGPYRVVRQREYSPEEIRRVAD